MNEEFVNGDRLLITLINGENYEGDFVRGTNTRIDIRDILHYDSGNRVDSTWCFYRKEITSVLKIKDSKKGDVTPVKPSKTAQDNTISMDREEYNRLKNVARSYIYIKFDDKVYYDAVRDISKFESVGVLAIGSERGKNGKITLLAISTWEQVYIFDLKSFHIKTFPEDIARIFSSHYIKKVVHNAGPLKTCLQYVYKIPLNNIFDTLVSQLLIAKTSGNKLKKLKNIGECLTEYFNFPTSLLVSSQESLKESWDFRPLPEEKIEKLSRLTTYLITLKDHQLELMLQNYNKACDNFHDLYINCSAYEGEKILANEEYTEKIDKIIPSKLLAKKEI